MAYNSSYTGSQIDAAVGTVQEMQDTPYLKANTGTSAYELPYSGAEISTKLAAIKTQSEIQSMINTTVNTLYTGSSTSVTGNGFTGYLYKYGRMVYFTVNAGSTSAAIAANGAIFTIPAGYRPIRAIEMMDTMGSVRVRVLADGTFCPAGAIAKSTNLRCSGAWFIA